MMRRILIWKLTQLLQTFWSVKVAYILFTLHNMLQSLKKETIFLMGKHKNVLLRDTIVASAKELFRTKGYSETTMNDIIQKAKTSKGNIYHHFKNKEDLFLHIFEQDISVWLDKWEEYSSQFHDPIKKIYALAQFSSDTNHSQYFHKATEEFFLSTFKNQETHKKIKELDQKYVNLFKEIIIHCIEDNKFDKDQDVDLLAHILMNIISAIEYSPFEELSFSRNKYYTKAIDIFLNGVIKKEKK